MSLFRMTPEQRADQDYNIRFYVSYFGTLVTAMVCAKLSGLSFHGSDFANSESSFYLLAAIMTFSTASQIPRLSWKALTIRAAVEGVVGFGIIALIRYAF